MTTLSRVFLGLVLSTSPALAQLQSVPPFLGDYNERFETQMPMVPASCIAEGVFLDIGELCTPNGAGAVIASSWNFNCNLTARTGAQFYGSLDGFSAIRFREPLRRFGGYFASNADTDNVRIRFFDPGGVLIGEDSVGVAGDCTWRWSGWRTMRAPIGSVEIENGASSGGFVMFDDLQILMYADIGTNYCTAAPNSATSGAILSATGSVSVAANDLVLASIGQPVGSPGLFYYGGGTLQAPFGDGFRCVAISGGGVQRLFPFQTTGAAGVMTHSVNYDNVMTASVRITPGSTWYFQSFYRDPAAGGAGFNFSDGLAITFEP